MMRFCYLVVLAQALFLSSPDNVANAFQNHVQQQPLTTTAAAYIARRAGPPSCTSTTASASASRLSMAIDPDEITTKQKETTWERITGPKLFKTVTNWNGIHSVPLVPLRILTGMLMIHHGSEGGIGPANFGTPEFQGFVDYVLAPHFSFLPGPLELWAALHDYAEFFGGIFFTLGFLTRPAALSLLVSMMSAVYFHLSAVGSQGFPLGHVSNYSYDFEEPLLYGLIFLVFWFNGAGPLSIDSIIYKSIAPEDDNSSSSGTTTTTTTSADDQ